MFVDRQQELAYFNNILTQARPGPAQLLLLYGRKRVGKSALLQHWVEYSGLSATYWQADREPPALQRKQLYAAITKTPAAEAPFMESWAAFWDWLATHLARDMTRRIIILDELPYASEADPALLISLRHAWDEQLAYGNTIFLLCGSHVKTMEAIMQPQSPLYGRLTGDWQLQPLPFHTLRQFLPSWDAADRVTLYSMIGGVPAYLTWLDPKRSLVDNLREVLLAKGSMFLAEPQLLLYDELRELSSYLAVLRAISNGHRSLSAISNESAISRTSIMFYLSRLQELQLVERRLPVTLTESQQRRSKRGRYFLRDPYFRFYFHFVAPHLRLQRSIQETVAHIQNDLPAFTKAGFETLAREWIAKQAQSGRATSDLPFIPEAIGSHWSRRVEVDVVAVNWRTRDILLAECDWGLAPVEPQMIVELAEKKGPLLKRDLPDRGEGWTFHYAIFTRTGLSEAAQAELLPRGGLAIHLSHLERGLSP
jgi:AAA+ ATPase superfamily predicted ATPase